MGSTDHSPENITRLLSAASSGDTSASERLLPLVYEELRQLAHYQMSKEKPGQTLQPTALVHEAYVRLVGGEPVEWNSRGHFFAAAARAMRRILVERARRYGRKKHGGGRRRIRLEAVVPASEERADQLLALDEALERLSEMDSRKSEIVHLRYFAGMTVEETAKALNVSASTVKTEWTFARAWLSSEMSRDD